MPTRLIRHILRVLIYVSVGSAGSLIVVFVLYLQGRPDLEVWHLAKLDEEFTVDSPVDTFSEYLDLEQTLFTQLDTIVYQHENAQSGSAVNRFSRGSLADPSRWHNEGNRSSLVAAKNPRAAVLLLHGLSDAPYSLINLQQCLGGSDATVLNLRIPGHGTAPSGLVDVRWQDMAKAVKLAVRHLEEIAPDAPLYIVGYSNGGALAVNHVLDNLSENQFSRVAGLVLISPQIGVTKVAAFAVWQARLGRWLGLDKLAWHDIYPEYDPFKYNSFAVNAGDVSYRITREIQQKVRKLESRGEMDAMPPVLAFSSVVDATVDPTALVDRLFNHLPKGNSELVLFDINRSLGFETLLRWKPDSMLGALQRANEKDYELSLVTNIKDESREVIVKRPWRIPSGDEPLGLEWPKAIHSLSHVSLPFPPSDSLYGGTPSTPSPGIYLGGVALRGERGALLVNEAAMLRLRWNPFYGYLQQRSLNFMGLEASADTCTR